MKLLSLARIPLRTTSVTGAQATGHANARLALTGGALVCSLFADEIRFVIGEHYQLICPGVVTYLNIPVQRDDFNRATFALQFRLVETWHCASESKIRFVEPMRNLLSTSIDPANRHPRLKTYCYVPLPPT